MLRITFSILFLFSFSLAQGQESNTDSVNVRVVDFDDIYIEKELLYEFANDQLYSGNIQRVKRNGQLIQEQYVENGIIHFTVMFYRGKLKTPHSKYIYNREKPYVLSKVMSYNLKGDLVEIIHYDNNGKKVLEEKYDEEKLVYSCEFNGRKRNGKEFCVTKECDTTIHFYSNGKKQRNKFK